MAYSYKCSISFGLVYIPVTLHLAVKSDEVGFNMLDKKTMSRIKYKKTCEECNGREVGREDIIKGYEYDKDKYVIFTDEELEKLKTKKDKNITIERFVDITEIDPIYYNRPYYVNPVGGEKAYLLLAKALESCKKVGIAKAVLGQKESLIAIRSKGGTLLLNTLYFYDEVQQNPVGKIQAEINKGEIELAKKIIEGMSGNFDAEEYKDEYSERITEAIERKIAGKEIKGAKEEKIKTAADLMEALQKSLSGLEKKSDKSAKAKKKRA